MIEEEPVNINLPFSRNDVHRQHESNKSYGHPAVVQTHNPFSRNDINNGQLSTKPSEKSAEVKPVSIGGTSNARDVLNISYHKMSSEKMNLDQSTGRIPTGTVSTNEKTFRNTNNSKKSGNLHKNKSNKHMSHHFSKMFNNME